MSIDQLLEKIARKIQPKPQEEKKIKTISHKVLEKAREEAKKYNADVILAGSLTRDTWLPNKSEIDVFVLFPKTFSKNQLEEVGLKVGKQIIQSLKGKWVIEYAQHPYVRGVLSNINIDIVPCYKLEKGEKIISAVDRTQFHVQYLNEKLPKQASKDVRLLKQFLKANSIYGADSKTQGFSGYLCELLIIHYKSFLNLLNAAKNWHVKEIIDIENQWKREDYHHLKKKFKNEILIVIDPVDKERNVASAVSAYNFFKFKKLAAEFIAKPREELFFPKKKQPLSSREFDRLMKSRGTDIIAVIFETPKVVPDILWPQLRKTTKRLENILEEYEFSVLKSDCWSDEKKTAVILLEMQVSRLPQVDKIKGPWVYDEKNSKNFGVKHKDDAIAGPYIEDDYWAVEVYRKWTSARIKLIDSISKDKKTLLAKGIPNFIASQLSRKFKVVGADELKKLLKNKKLAVFLRDYFEKENLMPIY